MAMGVHRSTDVKSARTSTSGAYVGVLGVVGRGGIRHAVITLALLDHSKDG
jgi:hypothetical protein